MISTILIVSGVVGALGLVVVYLRRQTTLSDSDFRAAVDAMQIGVTITDTNGTILHTNPADAKMHGYTPAELVGLPSNTLGAPMARKTVTIGEMGSLGTWARDSLNVHQDGTGPGTVLGDRCRVRCDVPGCRCMTSAVRAVQ